MVDLDETIEVLAAQFTDAFPAEIPQQRTIGREAEYPVVKATGEAADLANAGTGLAGFAADFDAGFASFRPILLQVENFERLVDFGQDSGAHDGLLNAADRCAIVR